MGRPNSIATAVTTSNPIVPTTPASSAAAPTFTCPTTPSGTPQGLSEMDVKTLYHMTLAKRLTWYSQQLGAYTNELRSSAYCNGIPMQLLATVILNELGDINWTDVRQQQLSNSGSLGIGQIQVSTAIADNLVNFPGDTLPLSDKETARRLTIPQYAIEAAAREIRQLLEKMTQNWLKPWPHRFGFKLKSFSSLGMPSDIYSYIDGETQRDKETNLAEMVVAAFNSPGIAEARLTDSITPGNPGFIYHNGTIHGGNSRKIARELYDNNLFH